MKKLHKNIIRVNTQLLIAIIKTQLLNGHFNTAWNIHLDLNILCA